MSWLDIILIIIIVIPTLIGLKTGIIKALLSLAGVIVGIVLAGNYYAALAGKLTFISQESVADIVAFAIILIGVMIVAAIIASVLKKIVSAIMLGWVNRLGGAILGFVLGAAFCGAILTMWTKFLGIADPIAESALATLLLDNFPLVLALLPEEFDSVRTFFQ